jgi:hypothetical protein
MYLPPNIFIERVRRYGGHFSDASHLWNVPAYLLQKIAWTESKIVANIGDGTSGEVGMMQINTAAISDVNRFFGTNYTRESLRGSGEISIHVAATYLHLLRKRLSLFDSIRAYNGGTTGILKSRTLSRGYARKVYYDY